MWNYFRLLSGGLRYAATTGYYLTAFQAETLRRVRGSEHSIQRYIGVLLFPIDHDS